MSGDFDPNYKEEKNYVRVGGKAVVSDEKGRVLFLRRSEKCSRAGGWDFPGGGMDKGEEPVEGIKREIKEEAGIEVKEVRVVDVRSEVLHKSGDVVVMLGYSCVTKDYNVKLSWEHDQFAWLDREEALRVELPKTHRSFLEKHFEFGFGNKLT